uniref:F-box domain-containing protein n=1 Tax=Biomphalaria glabrata TaxID=6526 RepID=A0A2C9LXG6_BIOGL
MSAQNLSQEWLDAIITSYKHLSDDDKNTFIDTVVAASGPNQLLHLRKLLPDLVFRDFICFLPLEIVQKLLQYLDGQQLLKCCQVSKIWNERLNSLPIIWRWLAQRAGADVQASERSTVDKVRTELQSNFLSESAFYKKLYLNTQTLLRGLDHGMSIKINENFIEKDSWRITTLAYQFGNLVTGCDDHTVQIWSVPDGKLLKTIATHSVSCLRLTDKHLFTASFNANAECWDLATGYHSRSLCGHTSAVIAIDVLPSKPYLLTGSVDKTSKLWHLGDTTSDLVKTFTVHEDWVFQVKFLPSTDDKLQFLTCDSLLAVVWHTDTSGNVLGSYHVRVSPDSRFTSFYHCHNDTFVIFCCQWAEEEKMSALCRYTIRPESKIIEKDFQFVIPQYAIKAYVLGAGEKFAVIMCSISRKDFYVIDIQQRTIVSTIFTPDFYILTRNGSTVTLCDDSWLDGFNFSALRDNTPVFAACVGRNTVILATWNLSKILLKSS